MSREIEIPTAIEAEIEGRLTSTEFESVEEYVMFVLHEIIDSNGQDLENETNSEDVVERRLEDLGYL